MPSLLEGVRLIGGTLNRGFTVIGLVSNLNFLPLKT